MKGKLVILLCVVAGLAAFSFWQLQQVQKTRANLAGAQRALANEQEARQELERQARFNDTAQRELREKVYELSAMVAGLRASEAKYSSNYALLAQAKSPAEGSETNAAAGMFGKGMREAMSKMMKDPAMREMMRAQQKLVFKPLYEPLMRELNLSPEQQQKFMELLLDQQMTSVEKSQAFFGDERKEEALAKTKEAMEASENGLKEFLGEEKFAHYKEYQKTLGDRMQLDQLKGLMAGTEAPLRDDQYNAVLGLIKEEREKSPPQFENSGQGPDFEKIFAGDTMDKHLAWQAELNRRVRERTSAGVLSPEQLKAFADFQEQQLNMQRLGMKMAREMFGKEGK